MCPLFGGSTVYLQLPPSLSTVLTSVTSLPPSLTSVTSLPLSPVLTLLLTYL